MNYESTRLFLESIGQTQLLNYYNELSEDERKLLLEDIENTNFSVVQNLHQQPKERGRLSPVTAVTVRDIEKNRENFEKVGFEMLSEGKVAAVLLAGGQGSRLGFSKPKGMFNIGVTRELSIFEQQMVNIREVTSHTGRHFLLLIMTSAENHDETVKFFEEHNYFGYPCDRIKFFKQDVAPTCDFEGKVFLKEKNRVSLAPNGNGGWYSSLVNSGLSKVLERENVEWLNVYSVDNVLQRICDPAFIGATILKGCRCGAKVVRKVNAEEKVGVLCLENGKPTVVEYYELPENLKNETKNGELVYCYGVTLNYLFNVTDLNSMLSGNLPYHLAKKAISHIEKGEKVTPSEPCGYKFETLVVDMVAHMGTCLAYEVERDKEFAPVKNATGADSVQSARELLKKNGVIL